MKKKTIYLSLLFSSFFLFNNIVEAGSTTAVFNKGNSGSSGNCNGTTNRITLCYNSNHKSVMISIVDSETGVKYPGSKSIVISDNPSYLDGAAVYGGWSSSSRSYSSDIVAISEMKKYNETNNAGQNVYSSGGTRFGSLIGSDGWKNFGAITDTLSGATFNDYKTIAKSLGVSDSALISENIGKYILVFEPVLSVVKGKSTETRYFVTDKALFKMYNNRGNTGGLSNNVSGCLHPGAAGSCPSGVSNNYAKLLKVNKGRRYNKIKEIVGAAGKTLAFEASNADGANPFYSYVWKNGFGLGIATIYDEPGCDPSTECCYDKNGAYHRGYEGDDKHYKKDTNGNLISCKVQQQCRISPYVDITSSNPGATSLDSTCRRYDNLNKSKNILLTFKWKESCLTSSGIEEVKWTNVYDKKDVGDISEASTFIHSQSENIHAGGGIDFFATLSNTINIKLDGGLEFMSSRPECSDSNDICVKETTSTQDIYNKMIVKIQNMGYKENLHRKVKVNADNKDITSEKISKVPKNPSVVLSGNITNGYSYEESGVGFAIKAKDSYIDLNTGDVHYDSVPVSTTNWTDGNGMLYTILRFDASKDYFVNIKGDGNAGFDRMFFFDDTLNSDCSTNITASLYKEDGGGKFDRNYFYRQIDLKVPFPNNSKTDYTKTNWKEYYGNDDKISDITTIGTLPEYRVWLNDVFIDDNTKYDLINIDDKGVSSLLLDKFLTKTDTIDPLYLDLGKVEKDGKVGDAR